jgi:hypothetical protein
VEKQHVRLYGPVLLRQPVFLFDRFLLFVYVFTFRTFALSLLIFGEFARKESVSGYLVPQAGLLKIKSSRTGFVSQSPVAQGDLAVEDQLLLSFFMESIRAIQSIKVFQQENERHSRWQNHYTDTINTGIRIGHWNIGYTTLNQLLFGVENIVIIYLPPMR